MRARVTIFFLVIILSFLIFFFSFIGNKTIYSVSKKINNSTWNILDTLNFDFLHESTNIKSYNLILFGKINQKYQYSNLYLFVDIYLENQKIIRDTLNCILYDNLGAPQQTVIGNTLFFKLEYLDKFEFQCDKTYEFKITHGMRDLNVHGVESVGLKVNKY